MIAPTTGPMSMPDIVAAAFTAYVKAPVAWLTLTLVSLVIGFVVQWVVTVRLDLGAEPTSEQLSEALPWLFAVLVGTVLADLFTHVALVAGALQVLRRGTLSVRDGYRTAVRCYLPVLVPTVLTGLLIGVLAATLLLLPLAVYLFVSWVLLPQVIVEEGEGPFRALGRSRQIVRGHWWHTAWVVLAVALLSVVLPSLVAGIVTGPFDATWVRAVGAALAAAAAAPFRSIAQTLLYADLRRRKGERPFVAPVGELP